VVLVHVRHDSDLERRGDEQRQPLRGVWRPGWAHNCRPASSRTRARLVARLPAMSSRTRAGSGAGVPVRVGVGVCGLVVDHARDRMAAASCPSSSLATSSLLATSSPPPTSSPSRPAEAAARAK
jgi:hypothetical protein